MYGKSVQTVCCSEGSLFMNVETAELVEPYLAQVKRVGEEYMSAGIISSVSSGS